MHLFEFLAKESRKATVLYEHPEPDFREQIPILNMDAGLFGIFDSWDDAMAGIKQFQDELVRHDDPTHPGVTVTVRGLPGGREGHMFVFIDDEAYFVVPF